MLAEAYSDVINLGIFEASKSRGIENLYNTKEGLILWKYQ